LYACTPKEEENYLGMPTASSFLLEAIKYCKARVIIWERSISWKKAPSRELGQVPRVEVVGSNPAGPTLSGAKIFKTSWALRKDGQPEGTLKSKGERMRHLAGLEHR